MSQVILIEPNENLNEILSLNLQAYTGAEVIPRDTASDAVNLMSILSGVSLVICRNQIDQEDSAKILYDFIKENDEEIGLIILGKTKHNINDLGIIQEDPNNFEETIKSASKILGVTDESLQKKIPPDYIPIPVKYFYPLQTTPCDVFIRIKKGLDDYQFVKRIHGGDTFSKAMILKYSEQGLKMFYIPKEMQMNFANSVSDQLVERLEEGFETVDQEISFMAQSVEIALTEIKDMGFTSATIQLTEAIIDNIIKSTKKSPEMSGMLRKIVNSKTSYLYRHCHMASIVANEMLKALSIDDEKLFQSMAYASLFKDISLVDNDELAKIVTFDELESAGLNEEDWDLVFNHALEASIMVRKQSEVPLGVDDIIKTHHGSQNGKGFSTVNVNKFTIQQQVFVISCEFVRELLRYKEEGGEPTPIVGELYKKYPEPNTAKAIKALESVLRKSKNAKPKN